MPGDRNDSYDPLGRALLLSTALLGNSLPVTVLVEEGQYSAVHPITPAADIEYDVIPAMRLH